MRSEYATILKEFCRANHVIVVLVHGHTRDWHNSNGGWTTEYLVFAWAMVGFTGVGKGVLGKRTVWE